MKATLLKENILFGELQQQLRVTLHSKGIFIVKKSACPLKDGYDT
jgi:hypothetical protein